jgi:hydrogenase nickel incorporation protein HypA/HybF
VHELSIAHAIVDTVADASSGCAVAEIRVRIGALSGVVADALRFAFDVAADGTSCAGARLVIDEVPVRVWCASCRDTADLVPPLRFRCPRCDEPSDDVRAGRELDIVSYTPAETVGA